MTLPEVGPIVNNVFVGKASLIHREALVHLCRMAQSAPKGLLVELGVYRGSSLAALTLARDGLGESIGVDDWSYPDPPDLLGKTMDTLVHNGVVAELLSMTSEEAAEQVPGPIAFLHIDANHTYEFVKKDIELWTPKVMPGGIVAFHDYGRHRADIQVKQAVDEWQAREPWLMLPEVLTTIGFRKP